MQTQRVVLVGGGHAHALVLRMWAMRPLNEVELVLVTNSSQAPYSGMLPGYIAGHYTYDDIHIDMRRLAEAAGACYIEGEVVGLDLANRLISIEGRPPLLFDVMSINVGSRPSMSQVPGADMWAVPVKPVGPFLERWNALCDQKEAQSKRIVIVGGGAGGTELAMAMRHRLGAQAKISVIHRGAELLSSYQGKVAPKLRRELSRQEITVELGTKVVEVQKEKVLLASGRSLPYDELFWVTQASPLPWFASSGLAVDDRGFLLVDDSLRCMGQAGIFAAGDCATIMGQPRPKAGVFAVRQAPVLFRNLKAALDDAELEKIKLQKEFLALISLGDKRAIATRSWFSAQGEWVWRWKDRIDREFMSRLSIVSPRNQAMSEEGMTRKPSDSILMRCFGCGSKIGPYILSNVLQRLQQNFPEVSRQSQLHWGLEEREDVMIWEPPLGQKVLQTMDYFPSLVKDPFLSGQIACNHAVNDILAKGARPHSVLALAVLPVAADHLTSDRLYQMLAGVATQLRELRAELGGGHSAEGKDLALGLMVNGLPDGKLLPKDTGLAGDQLILTKALGTGIIFAAQSQGVVRGYHVDAAITSMLRSQHVLRPLLLRSTIHASTDVSGFGFLGHLHEMLRLGFIQAEIDLRALPILPGVWELAEQNVSSSLLSANLEVKNRLHLRDTPLSPAEWNILCDPQTAGGLLLSVAGEAAVQVLGEMHQLGFVDARIIGHLRQRNSEDSLVVFKR